LITLIIVQLISLWFNYTSSIYSILAIILFSLFIIYDVNRLSKLTCDNTNFIDQGLTIFLDILNMFTNVHRLNNN
jgi:FtsH-binding integral membrane protein